MKHDLVNFGFSSRKLSDDDIKPIINEIDDIKKNFHLADPANSYLIGNIEKEFHIVKSKDHLEKLILPVIDHYVKNNDYLRRITNFTSDTQICLQNAWVNFQSKYEFNPCHDHDGVFSFVIWTHVPYDINTEKNNAPGKDSRHNLAGAFEFQYTNILGEIYTHAIHVDKSVENVLILFPSKLRHCVYPFYTSDDYRISVSGNFVLKN
jgi:hypothetical protein